MQAIPLKEGIYWVGGIDWDVRNFHGYQTQRGTTYNAYLIIDEKITLIDTVKHTHYDEMMTRIRALIDPKDISYIVSNHVEMDHSGGLVRLSYAAPHAQIITSPQGKKGLARHFKKNFNFCEVKTGDTLSLGKQNLSFVQIPMVHWPDSMVTYLPEQKLLFPNDAFGQHIASIERFDDEIDNAVLMHEAAKYYANIVLPYGAQVKKALEAVKPLAINMIAPSHGIIWRNHIPAIIEKYTQWAEQKMTKKAVIVFDSMWGSTQKIANAILDAFQKKHIPVVLRSLKTDHISDIMTDILEAEYIAVGSPTLNNNVMPAVAGFLTYLKGLAPRNRKAIAFGSYGWGGQSASHIAEKLQAAGCELILDPIKIPYVPDRSELDTITQNSMEVL